MKEDKTKSEKKVELNDKEYMFDILKKMQNIGVEQENPQMNNLKISIFVGNYCTVFESSTMEMFSVHKSLNLNPIELAMYQCLAQIIDRKIEEEKIPKENNQRYDYIRLCRLFEFNDFLKFEIKINKHIVTQNIRISTGLEAHLKKDVNIFQYLLIKCFKEFETIIENNKI